MLTFIFDSKSRTPLYMQLYEYIRGEIECGNIKKGEKLPSKRTLSAHLKISQVTVETAYAQLIDEGYIISRPKSGYYAAADENIYSRKYPDTVPQAVTAEKNKYQYDFTTRGVDTDCFPFSVWAKLSRRILAEESQNLLKSADTKGVCELRNAIALYLHRFRGISVSPERIVVGAGSEYLTGLIIQLLGRNRIYGVENPGYMKTHTLFRKNDVKVMTVESGEKGLSVEDLKSKNCNIIHTTPSHHFPLGTVMPISERIKLLQWANQNSERYIIEDEYDSEFRFTGRPVPSLLSLDNSDKVIYMNTFTKTLAPSLRIGYMILPEPLMQRFERELGFYSNTVPVFEQLTLSKFISEGFFERHINRIKKVYRQRRDLLINAFNESSISDKITIEGENTGLHFIVRFNSDIPEKTFVETARKASVKVCGINDYYNGISPPENHRAGIIIGYSSMPENDIKTAVNILISVWSELLSDC